MLLLISREDETSCSLAIDNILPDGIKVRFGSFDRYAIDSVNDLRFGYTDAIWTNSHQIAMLLVQFEIRVV